MKNIYIYFVAAIVVLVFFACSNDNNNPPDGNQSSSSEVLLSSSTMSSSSSALSSSSVSVNSSSSMSSSSSSIVQSSSSGYGACYFEDPEISDWAFCTEDKTKCEQIDGFTVTYKDSCPTEYEVVCKYGESYFYFYGEEAEESDCELFENIK